MLHATCSCADPELDDGSAKIQAQPQSASGAQRDQGVDPWLRRADRQHPTTAQQCCEDERRLHEGDVTPDAQAGPCTEGQVVAAGPGRPLGAGNRSGSKDVADGQDASRRCSSQGLRMIRSPRGTATPATTSS